MTLCANFNCVKKNVQPVDQDKVVVKQRHAPKHNLIGAKLERRHATHIVILLFSSPATVNISPRSRDYCVSSNQDVSVTTRLITSFTPLYSVLRVNTGPWSKVKLELTYL